MPLVEPLSAFGRDPAARESGSEAGKGNAALALAAIAIVAVVLALIG
jgi:hypothetical protein